TFSGTARYLHEEQGAKALQEFIRLLNEACRKHYCSYEFIEKPYPTDLFVHNNETCSEIAEQSISTVLVEAALTKYHAWMASEPFGFYHLYYPGVFAFVVIRNEQRCVGAEHHNAYFDIDEDALKLGVASTVKYALDFLTYQNKIPFEKETRDIDKLFKDL